MQPFARFRAWVVALIRTSGVGSSLFAAIPVAEAHVSPAEARLARIIGHERQIEARRSPHRLLRPAS